MAVVVNAVTTDTQAFASSLLISHLPAGSDRLLLVVVAWRNDRSVTSVVFNGTETLTRLGGIEQVSSGRFVDIWYRINPTATTANVVITMSGAVAVNLAGVVYSLTGVHQTTPLGSIVTTQDSVNPGPQPSLVVSSATDELVIDGLDCDDTAITVGAGQTQRFNNNGDGSSTEPGAASVTMSWSALANFTAYAYAAVAVKVAVAGSASLTPPVGGLVGASGGGRLDSGMAVPAAVRIG